MPIAIVTGSEGLIGSDSVRHFIEAGCDLIDLEPFKLDYPGWDIRHDVPDILREIHDRNAE
jgi:hypothetical protein